MQIIAELDLQHHQKIRQLQKILGENIATVLEIAIDELYARHQTAIGEKAKQIFQRNGFIGCLHEENDLSLNYKCELDWSNKL